MTILPIVLAPDDRLLICSQKIEKVDGEIRKLLDDMLETMHDSSGVGLAAVQVDIHKRLFVAQIPEDYVFDEEDESGDYKDYKSVGGPYHLVNPVITEYSDDVIDFREGCLSVPKQDGEVVRPRRITVEALDYYGKKKIIKARGWLSRCFQHEIDHLNGKLFIERMSKLKYEMAIKKAQKVKKLLTQNK